MSDVILVVLERPKVAAQLLHAAECLAVLMGGARVNVLALRTPPGYAALTAEASLTGGLQGSPAGGGGPEGRQARGQGSRGLAN
jgi:hypothetical protein